jgi:hypothetical protein
MSESEAKRCWVRSLRCWSHKTLESNMSVARSAPRLLSTRVGDRGTHVQAHCRREGVSMRLSGGAEEETGAEGDTTGRTSRDESPGGRWPYGLSSAPRPWLSSWTVTDRVRWCWCGQRLCNDPGDDWRAWLAAQWTILMTPCAPVMLTPVPVPLVHKAASPTGAHSPGHIAPTLYASPRHASHQDHLPLRQRSAHAPVPGATSRSAVAGQALTPESPPPSIAKPWKEGEKKTEGHAAAAKPLTSRSAASGEAL